MMRTWRVWMIAAVGVMMLGTAEVAFGQNFADLEEVPAEQAVDVGAPMDQAVDPAMNAVITGQGTDSIDPLSDENLKEVVKMTQSVGLSPDESTKYTLGPTDIIQVSVMRHPEVSGRYEINMEGKIQYEFVGDIQVAGLTKDELAKNLSDKLKEFIINPEVNVKIVGYNSKIVFVVGEVGRPGKIFMRGNTITVREALMEAGLPLLSGITKKTRLITPAEDGNIIKRDVDVHALLYEGDLRENLVMSPGDVLYIPPTFLTKTMRAISPVTEPVTNAAGAAGSVYVP